MVISSPETKQLTDLELMAHLYRRAGFGATREQLEASLAKGYETTVEEFLHPESQPDIEEDLMLRYYADMMDCRTWSIGQSMWVYRMINTQRPLQEKLTLFWHNLFATGFAKTMSYRGATRQIATLREHAMGDFRTMLVEVSKNPEMIVWLDNQMNTNDVHNENFGRELLELFSMGIGNYTEDDVKNCARAFTGWTLKPTIPSYMPYMRYLWEFEFRPDLHDFGEKEFLGERGNFDGTDIIDIIVRQPATAHFLAYRLHKFFVSDTPDEQAIEELARVYVESHYDIRAMMRALLLSDAFRSSKAYYTKVKSPAEHVVGLMRLIEDFQIPRVGLIEVMRACTYMGQDLMNPPSVEGWHTGKEWLDTGILVERINFAATQVGNTSMPGMQKLLGRLRAIGELTPEHLVDACLDLMGPMDVSDTTREALLTFARKGGNLRFARDNDGQTEQRVAELLQLIVATREFQLV